MGSNDRNFDAGSCNVSDKVDLGAEKNITCTCQNDTCHVTHIDLEANQFSGQVPPEIEKLVNLRTLRLFYNRLTGDLPVQLAELKNLTDL
ncbi:hypothetical protein Goarm_022542 [Gossypium armourianum]|uniref:Uncharacterized protein n=1 Tax=Gossypium armourianum TaxID=34283 RepID=A0A7J9KFG7_9ROSI|nr:hypothetical protein [Gossypium armourianum]